MRKSACKKQKRHERAEKQKRIFGQRMATPPPRGHFKWCATHTTPRGAVPQSPLARRMGGVYVVLKHKGREGRTAERPLVSAFGALNFTTPPIYFCALHRKGKNPAGFPKYLFTSHDQQNWKYSITNIFFYCFVFDTALF